MTSEWMRVMLDEIARKKDEARAARIEFDRRAGDGEPPLPPADPGRSTPGGSAPGGSAPGGNAANGPLAPSDG